VSRAFPGDRRVWLTAAGVLAVLAVALLKTLVFDQRPEPYTGTNSVAARSVVAEASRGQELCVPALNLPPGTHRIQLNAGGGPDGSGPRPAVRAEVRHADGGVERSTLPARSDPGSGPLDIPVTPRGGAHPTGVMVCVTPSGRLAVGGMLGVYTADQEVTPTVAGKPIGGAVAVWYLPEAGSSRSVASMIPRALARAAVFRPGWIGTWTYVLLYLLVVPFVLYGSVRLLARTAAGQPTRVRPGLAIFLVAATNAAVWALVTPIFDAPDEYDHFAYAQYLAETGHAPARGASDRPPWSSAESLALDEARPLSYIEIPSGRPRWLEQDEQRFNRRNDAIRPSPSNGGGNQTAATHGPLYYGLLVPAYYAGSGGSIFTQITLMRLVSALLCGIVALCAYGVVRELLPRHPMVAVASGLIVAFHPMLTFMGGAVNNDAGVNAVGAVVVYLLVRGLRRGLTPRTAVALGAALVALPLMKATGFVLYPAAIVALLGMLWRRHGSRDLVAYGALAAAFVAVTVAWTLIAPAFDRGTFTTPGGAAPLAAGGVGGSALSDPAGYASYVWQVFLPKLPFMTDLHPQAWPARDIYVERGWAAFGWYTIKFQSWVYTLIALAMIGVALLCVATLWRERVTTRRRKIEVAVLVLVIAGMVGGVHAAYFTPTGGRAVVAEQGRYAFLAMAALAPIAAGAVFAFGRRWVVPIAAGLACSTMALWVLSQVIAVRGFFA
jgi:hypothetical protein